MALSRLRLRTQLLLAMIPLVCVLTVAVLLVIRHIARNEVRSQTQRGLQASVEAFQRVQRDQSAQLSHMAQLVADLPTLKALMSTEHAATIQDGSQDFWKRSGEDLLVLTNRDGQTMAVHANSSVFSKAAADQMMKSFTHRKQSSGWWRVDNELYQVELEPVVAGAGTDERSLGTLAVGRQMNTAVAAQLARLASSEVALFAGNTIVASTLNKPQEAELQQVLKRGDGTSSSIDLAGRAFDASSVELDAGAVPISCLVLLPLDAESAFIARLNRSIALLGILSVIGAGLVIIVFSRTMTHPVEDLVRAVRAFGTGDYEYSIEPRGSAEIAELSVNFNQMRAEVQESQRRQLQAERLAALGRAASSISHDLRHHLATVLANAEFLREAEALKFDRGEVYREIERASDEMTELIDSLVEIARDRNPISPSAAKLDEVVKRAIDQVHTSPEFRQRNIEVIATTATDGVFDGRKIGRALYNILLNACEATSATMTPRVGVDLDGSAHQIECRIWDNGPGVPAEIEQTLFEPFVSAGKNNGTGLGLAIASKIIADHGGELVLEKSSAGGTSFLIRIPRKANVAGQRDAASQPA